MYKTMLQHLCQQRKWPLPEYTSSKDGPDHNPTFTATVSVNGEAFSGADQSRTSKEAQNKVAQIAYEHLTGVYVHVAPPLASAPKSASSSDSLSGLCSREPSTLANGSSSQVKDDKKFIDAPHLYKNRLQSYALKHNLTIPVYSCEREGPLHALRYRCKVTFQGKTIESSEFYKTIKEAEHAAAKIAWESWSLDEVHQDDSALYKNILQEFLQREGCPVPKYETTVSGPSHMPIFVSKVNIRGQVYEGQTASSKKQAESYAAKVAFLGLQNQEQKKAEENNSCYGQYIDTQRGFTSGSQILKALERSSSALQEVIATAHDVPPRVTPNDKLQVPAERSEEYAVELASSDEAPSSYPETDNSVKRLCLPSSDSVNFESLGFSSNGINSVLPRVGSSDTKTTGKETVVVCPRMPNMTYPAGASVLPFSDDKWVAVKMNSN